MVALLNHPDFYLYCSIPIVAGAVGWFTNWIAIQLMFYPIEFVGYRPLYLGWQGVIPSKAKTMAIVVVRKGLQTLTNEREVFERIDRQDLATKMVRVIESQLDDYIDELMMNDHPVLWENLPKPLKQRFKNHIHANLPTIVDDVLDEIGEQVNRFIDLEDMVINRLVQDKALINRIFQEAGAKEFRFIINSGAYFGFVFGLIQMALWFFLQEWWVLPLFGLLIGYATNELALRLIFEPLHPIKIGKFSFQGLFLKRQDEVSAVFSDIVTTEVITIQQILLAMLTGPKCDATHQLIANYIRKAIDKNAGLGVWFGTPIVRTLLGTRQYIALKTHAIENFIELADREIQRADNLNTKQKSIIQELLRSRMAALSSEQFQDVLRPAFKADEWKLILVGALLGLAAGTMQLLFVFS